MIGRAIVAALAAFSLLTQPAFAQVSFPSANAAGAGGSMVYPPTTGGGSICDPTTETSAAITASTTVTSGSTGSKGSWTSLGTASSELNGFYLIIEPSTISARGLIDISISSGTTMLVTNYMSFGQPTKIFLPIHVPASSALYARSQSNGSAQVVTMAMIGKVKAAGCWAGFTAAEALNPDTTNTRGGVVDVPLTTTWTDLLGGGTTSRAYSGFVLSAGASTANPATAQTFTYALGTGASGSETLLSSGLGYAFASTSGPQTGGGFQFFASVASGSRIVGQATAATPGSDNLRMNVLGLY